MRKYPPLNLNIGNNVIKCLRSEKVTPQCVFWEWQCDLCTVFITRWKNPKNNTCFYIADISSDADADENDIGFESDMSHTTPQAALNQLMEEIRRHKDWFDLVVKEDGIIADILKPWIVIL